MQDIQPELIEKYQLLLQKDPKSQVFAPLTEAYRKMGLIEEAFRIAVRGVQFNPNFGGGRIALAKVFLARDNFQGAMDELEKAVELSPDNIMAHSLLADCYLKSRRSKEALRAFKMVLFLAPNHEKAAKAVKKLESLTADEYDDDLFEMRQLPQPGEMQAEAPAPLKPITDSTALERRLSLIDAYIVRGDVERALSALHQGEREFGSHPELLRRIKLVEQRAVGVKVESNSAPPPNRAKIVLDEKIQLLRRLLARVERKSQFT